MAYATAARPSRQRSAPLSDALCGLVTFLLLAGFRVGVACWPLASGADLLAAHGCHGTACVALLLAYALGAAFLYQSWCQAFPARD